MSAMPRLPDPLTPDGLRELMRQRPYWDLSHPRSPLYRRLVDKGFEILYPGPGRYDAIGRMIDTQPLKPQYVTHLVAQTNREMEGLERAIEGDGGTVHVRAHTRVVDGKSVEVSAYERTAPEGGGVDPKRAPGTPEVRTLEDRLGRDGTKQEPLGPARLDEDPRDGAHLMADARAGDEDGGGEVDEADALQAAADRPKLANPLPDLPKIEIRDDEAGDGHFGASRERPDGTKYDHPGVDIKVPPGTPVTSPVDGKIEIRDSYRNGRYDNEFKNVWVKTEDGTVYGHFYVTPHDDLGNPLINNGDRVRAGDPIGTVQDRASRDPSGKMENHIHLEIRDPSGNAVDPTPHVEEWQKE